MEMCNIMSHCEFDRDEFNNEFLYSMAAEK